MKGQLVTVVASNHRRPDVAAELGGRPMSARFDGARAAILAAAESRWQLRRAQLVAGDVSPRVDRYLISDGVVFQAVDRASSIPVAPLHK